MFWLRCPGTQRLGDSTQTGNPRSSFRTETSPSCRSKLGGGGGRPTAGHCAPARRWGVINRALGRRRLGLRILGMGRRWSPAGGPGPNWYQNHTIALALMDSRRKQHHARYARFVLQDGFPPAEARGGFGAAWWRFPNLLSSPPSWDWGRLSLPPRAAVAPDPGWLPTQAVDAYLLPPVTGRTVARPIPTSAPTAMRCLSIPLPHLFLGLPYLPPA